jgi:phosphomannomutase
MFSVSGLRGIVGEDLKPDIIRQYAKLFGEFFRAEKVVMGRDCRPSGPDFRDAVIRGLNETGIDVIDLGIVPTPTVCFMVKKLKAQAGIAITASHNPRQWNALKFITDRGEFPVEKEFLAFARFVKKNELHSPARKAGRCRVQKSGAADHILSAIAALKLKPMKLRIGVDAVNGAGSEALPALLKKLGCRVYPLFCSFKPDFPRKPEPTPENITGLCRLVRQKKLDLGLAIDPDGDRLSIVDDKGRAIGEEMTLVLAADYVLGLKKGGACTNLSTTALMDYVCERYGCRLYRSKVGEANVVEMMKKVKAVIGGEGNGGVIYPAVNPTRDALTGTSIILKLLQSRGKKLSAIVAEYPVYHMIKDKIILDRMEFEDKAARLSRALPGTIDRRDGLRITNPDWWLHIRPSNTEPIVRIIGEGRILADIQRRIREARKILTQD